MSISGVWNVRKLFFGGLFYSRMMRFFRAFIAGVFFVCVFFRMYNNLECCSFVGYVLIEFNYNIDFLN